MPSKVIQGQKSTLCLRSYDFIITFDLCSFRYKLSLLKIVLFNIARTEKVQIFYEFRGNSFLQNLISIVLDFAFGI